MGTRGLMGLVIDGQVKSSYNHWDSYPSALGTAILADLNEILATPERYELAKTQARNLVLVDENGTPTDEQIEALKIHWNPDVSTGAATEWYSLLRDLQGQFLGTLQAGVMIDGAGFELDSLFCEWAYLVDFDREVLEVYRGFQKERHDEGRWAGMPTDEDIAKKLADLKAKLEAGEIDQGQHDYWAQERYHSVALIASFEFGNITDEQLASVEKQVYGSDD